MRSVLTSTRGGVLTREAGAVTGDLEAATVLQQGSLAVSVRYAGAEEWYTVAGSPAQTSALPWRTSAASHERLHQDILRVLTTPGPVSGSNEQPVDLGRVMEAAD